MRYVLDASVGLKTVLPETDSDKAEMLVAEFQQQIHELIAPDTYLVECAHALTRAHISVISPEEIPGDDFLSSRRPKSQALSECRGSSSSAFQ